MTRAPLDPFTTWLLAGERPMFDFGFFPLFLFVQWPLAGALIPVLVLAAVLVRRAPAERPLSGAAVTLLGPLYCGVLPSALLVLRYAARPERSWAATWLVV